MSELELWFDSTRRVRVPLLRQFASSTAAKSEYRESQMPSYRLVDLELDQSLKSVYQIRDERMFSRIISTGVLTERVDPISC